MAAIFSKRLDANVILKGEGLQPIWSFKIRGAYIKLAHFSEGERTAGVVSCSAGSHAQGVAYSARQLDISSTIVMPTDTPATKHENVAHLGRRALLRGAAFDAAREKCVRLRDGHGLIMVPPFDDPYAIVNRAQSQRKYYRKSIRV